MISNLHTTFQYVNPIRKVFKLVLDVEFQISMQLVLRKSSYKPLNLDLDGRKAGRTASLPEAPPA